jgi:hypothetical protein
MINEDFSYTAQFRILLGFNFHFQGIALEYLLLNNAINVQRILEEKHFEKQLPRRLRRL